MHLMAVYCELVGLQPMAMVPIITGTEDSSTPRIRRQRGDYEQQLQVFPDPVCCDERWRVVRGGLLSNYIPTTWEEIPDELMDTLSIELINELRDHP